MMEQMVEIPQDLLSAPEHPILGTNYRYLRALAQHTRDSQHKHTWGLTIYRTVYSNASDALFPLVVQRIQGYMRLTISRLVDTGRIGRFATPGEKQQSQRVTDELLQRNVNDVIENKHTLDNASIHDVYSLFNAWVEAHNGRDSMNSRYRIALIIDQDAIDSIMKLPEADQADTMFWRDRLVVNCKAVSRWRIDSVQNSPWFYVVLKNLTELWFDIMEEDLRSFVTPVEGEQAAWEMLTARHLYRCK